LAGSLNLKGKEPSTRSEIYEKYLKDKIRRWYQDLDLPSNPVQRGFFMTKYIVSLGW
jgi:hypothetical protein